MYSSLKGLFTIGTDANNRSVKVSLEFVEEQTTEAVKNATTATEAANKATEAAKTATSETQTATKNANTATEAANTATKNADAATAAAKTATTNADTATDAAKAATTEAEKATDASKTATAEAQAATGEAKTSTAAANKATSDVLAAFAGLVPSSLTVKYNERLTLGNIQPVYINAELQPEGTLKNVLFLSDNKAVTVNPDGRVQIVAKGRSVIHVIPTCNTAIAKTIAVTVEEPTMRLVNTRSQMRFTQSGGIRLN
ncbi:hypothetical protein [Alistipes putredinis]|uniref:hypothetical protein n=1 Tax=Alistipes putredinis TaxID=28117 RepID=UPI003A89BFD6